MRLGRVELRAWHLVPVPELSLSLSLSQTHPNHLCKRLERSSRVSVVILRKAVVLAATQLAAARCPHFFSDPLVNGSPLGMENSKAVSIRAPMVWREIVPGLFSLASH